MATQQELLTQQLSKLADTFRKKFNTTKGLTIDDMTKLNSPNLLASFTGPYTEPETNYGNSGLYRISFFNVYQNTTGKDQKLKITIDADYPQYEGSCWLSLGDYDDKTRSAYIEAQHGRHTYTSIITVLATDKRLFPSLTLGTFGSNSFTIYHVTVELLGSN